MTLWKNIALFDDKEKANAYLASMESNKGYVVYGFNVESMENLHPILVDLPFNPEPLPKK